MDVKDILAELFSYTQFGIKLGLGRVRLLLSALGDPQDRFPSIHVAGTNGKGSTAAMAASILQAAGLRVGLYTSPHLCDFSERIRIDDRPIEGADIARHYLDIKRVWASLGKAGVEEGDPTFFELTTAMAFRQFAERRVDAAVIETGLGGRLDATNVLRPIVTVLTTISRDHEAHLGGSISAIAREKAGIIKPGVPVVAGSLVSEAEAVVEQAARERGAKVVRLGEEFRAESVRLTAAGGTFDWTREDASFSGLTVPLAGVHQVRNAAVAAAAATEAARASGGAFDVGEQAVREGLRRVSWPGRFEVLSSAPMVILDGAHNPEGICALVDTLSLLAPSERRTLVFGALADKDAGRMLAAAGPAFDRIVLVRPESERAADPRDLADLVPDGPEAIVRESVGGALAEILDGAGARDRIVVAGSLYLVGEARASFRAAGARTLPVQ
ncbi:MAG: folylpolyglutamate synthase/dihydrofolate synthase family protein [Nitrospirota bacterium]